jgi:DMSO/TMAO reductase YedYZ molybdopterin-dependent catalytic subunit
MLGSQHPSSRTTRRRFLRGAGIVSALAATAPAWAQEAVMLDLPGGPDRRTLTTQFPQKGRMILQRSRPPLLETPFEVFDRGVFTPNDQFFVRWHWAMIPEEVNVATFRLAVRGHVNRPLSLSLADVLALPRVELAAVNQCSGNSRGLFEPRVSGGQWANGAMGNAKWTGVRLRDVLDRAGVKPGAVVVRFNGLDEPVVDGAPDFMKSLDIDHARNGEVMLAYEMNGEQLPLLNGFPLRLIVPGWYSTYWVKMLNDIEVLDAPDGNYWMATAYRIPDTPGADVRPGETGVKTVPINRMVPRSFFTNITEATKLPPVLRWRRAASPSAVTAVWRRWSCPPMAGAAGGAPTSARTRAPIASADGRRRLPRHPPARSSSASAVPIRKVSRSRTDPTGTAPVSCAT